MEQKRKLFSDILSDMGKEQCGMFPLISEAYLDSYVRVTSQIIPLAEVNPQMCMFDQQMP